MLNINDILFKYILEKYGSISDFADYSGIPLIELNAILLKDNIPLDIRSGLMLCKKLNIDIEKLIFDGEISEISSKEADSDTESKETKELMGLFFADGGTDGKNAVSETELRDRYMRLSEIEKKEVLEFIDKISDRHDEHDEA